MPPDRFPEMVVSVEHNSEFILIHTAAGYGRAVARSSDYHAVTGNFRCGGRQQYCLVAPRVVKRTALVHKQINYLLRTN
jgi:arginine repressor